MLEINCQERRRRWAAPRAEISQEPRVMTAQARAASPDRGHSRTGSNRARLGEGQLPQGPGCIQGGLSEAAEDKARDRIGVQAMTQNKPSSWRKSQRDWRGVTHSNSSKVHPGQTSAKP